MNLNQSFFQKLSDSFSSIFPFNSTTREDVSNVSFDRNLLSPITTTSSSHSYRRLASEAFGRDDDNVDEMKSKRARLHYDLRSLPTSRIIKPITNQFTNQYNNVYNNNFNDAASELSDNSNISISTSGVSSLHPHYSSKRFNLGLVDSEINGKYQRDLNVVSSSLSLSQSTTTMKHFTKDFISSPAKKILEKLDKLTTPITAGDKLATLLARQQTAINSNYQRINASNPYHRPPIARKKPIPIKVVTVSATSKQNNCGPIRTKTNHKSMKRIGFIEDVDLDCEEDNIAKSCNNYPNFTNSQTVSLSNIPKQKISVSTNTDETSFINNNSQEESFELEFSFRPPQTINDEEYLEFKQQNKPVSYEFKSKITDIEKNNRQKRIDIKEKWKCDICNSHNSSDSLDCRNCESVSNRNVVVISDKAIPTGFDKTDILKTLLENETVPTGINTINESNKFASGFSQSNDLKLSIFNATTSSSLLGLISISISSSNQNTISLNQAETLISKTLSTPVAFSIEKKPETIVSSTGFSFGQTSSDKKSSTISTPSVVSSTSESKSTFPFGVSIVSTAPLISFNAKTSTSSVSETKPFTLGIISNTTTTGLSISSSNQLFSNAETSKSFSFDKLPVAETTSNNGITLSSVGTAATTMPKPFSFGQISTTPIVTASSESKPFSFGQISTIPIVTAPTESKPFSFGQISTIPIVTAPTESKPFSFGQISTIPIVTASSESKPFSFGQISAMPTVTAPSESKPFSFNTKPNNVETTTPKPFSFGQISTTVTPEVKPFTFDQKPNVADSTKPFSTNSQPFSTHSQSFSTSSQPFSKPHSFGQITSSSSSAVATSNNLFTDSKPLFGATSGSSSFAFGKSINNPAPSTTANEPVKSSLFNFQNQTTEPQSSSKLFPTVSSTTTSTIFGTQSLTDKPAFNFGKTNNSEITTKSDLFGGSGSSSGFAFGQQTNNLTSSSSSSSLFGDSLIKPASTTSMGLFGNNGTSNSAGSNNNLFGTGSNESVKPFIFTPQSSVTSLSSVINTSNNATSGFAFNNPITTSTAPVATSTGPLTMTFGNQQSLTPFPLTSNVSSQSNIFGSSQFTFGASSNSSSGGMTNMFGSNPGGNTLQSQQAQQQPQPPAAASGFNFSSNQPVFQFGGSINTSNAPQPNNNNVTNCSSLPAGSNQRRLLKVRRNRK